MAWREIRQTLARLDAFLSDGVYDHGLHLAGLDQRDEQASVEPVIARRSWRRGRLFSTPHAWRFIFHIH
ncbi:hypothetical protein RZS28_14775 [Methylocapsa polymorpha]|uniref:Uncharacterized protein n=1 Tax=Methylocapsa polymorpha TaxID=3080828 RepID=A0ABZ0HT35_9HYPH|nr:hypothetical protein RZS28_14775 [Methylocapsa sp. RX1]